MTELRQRQPRVEDPAHLAAIRRLPCIVCRKPGPNDAAHIRSGSLFYNKRRTGFGEKPDDKWTLPLCRADHDEQHRGNELAFWRRHGINPFREALRLYGDRVPPLKTEPVKPRKPKAQRRPIQQRSNFPPKGSRHMNRKERV